MVRGHRRAGRSRAGAPAVRPPRAGTLTHNKALHEELVLLTVVTAEVPEVPDAERFTSERLADWLYRVVATYGFMEPPDVPDVLRRCCEQGLRADPADTSYYLGRARILPTGPMPMMRWRKLLYAFLAWNARTVTEYLKIPPDRVVELGAHIAL